MYGNTDITVGPFTVLENEICPLLVFHMNFGGSLPPCSANKKTKRSCNSNKNSE